MFSCARNSVTVTCFPALETATCFPALVTVTCFPALATVTCFPALVTVTCFPTLSTVSYFYCTWNSFILFFACNCYIFLRVPPLIYVFARLLSVTCFLRLCFPRKQPVTCFPEFLTVTCFLAFATFSHLRAHRLHVLKEPLIFSQD